MALWWACQDLNLGPHPYQGSAPGPVSAGWRLPPARTTYRWKPLETVANRSAPMACGPNVDQVEYLGSAQVTGGRVHRSPQCGRVMLRPHGPSPWVADGQPCSASHTVANAAAKSWSA